MFLNTGSLNTNVQNENFITVLEVFLKCKRPNKRNSIFTTFVLASDHLIHFDIFTLILPGLKKYINVLIAYNNLNRETL